MKHRLSDVRFNILLTMDQLCIEASYDNISVGDICNAAGVSRATFYRAFESKYHISTWFQDLVLGISIGEVGRTLTWHDGLLEAYDGWLIAPHVNAAAQACKGLECAPANCKRTISKCLMSTIAYRGMELTEVLDFQIRYFSSAVSVPQSDWYLGFEMRSVEPVVNNLVRCVPRDLFDALNVPREPKPSKRLALSDLRAADQKLLLDEPFITP